MDVSTDFRRQPIPCVALKGETGLHEQIAFELNKDPAHPFRVLSMSYGSPVLERKNTRAQKQR